MRPDKIIHDWADNVWCSNDCTPSQIQNLQLEEILHIQAVEEARVALKTFPLTTQVGVDVLSPYLLRHLCDEALFVLISLSMFMELLGEFPPVIKYVIMVAIPKSSGGER